MLSNETNFGKTFSFLFIPSCSSGVNTPSDVTCPHPLQKPRKGKIPEFRDTHWSFAHRMMMGPGVWEVGFGSCLCHRMIWGPWLDFSGSQLFIYYLDEMTFNPLYYDYDYFWEYPWLGKVSLHPCQNYDRFIWLQKGPELSHSLLSCKKKINLYFVTVSPGQELVSQTVKSLLFLKCV